jgi:thiol-disulfide isomerase/thioredoxin
LVARVTLPPPVKKGDTVPSLKLLDLTGETVDVAALRGRRTLLLFWNPSCGFCQKMLPDVKTWKRPASAPELVVISSGSPEVNRDQGFSAKVLLDPYFGSTQVFGAAGTPSAVVLDEEGRVASEVVVGAPAVFALAGVEVPAGWP